MMAKILIPSLPDGRQGELETWLIFGQSGEFKSLVPITPHAFCAVAKSAQVELENDLAKLTPKKVQTALWGLGYKMPVIGTSMIFKPIPLSVSEDRSSVNVMLSEGFGEVFRLGDQSLVKNGEWAEVLHRTLVILGTNVVRRNNVGCIEANIPMPTGVATSTRRLNGSPIARTVLHLVDERVQT